MVACSAAQTLPRKPGSVPFAAPIGPEQEGTVDTYVILRRRGWRTAADLEEAAGRSTKVADEEMSDDVRWIRSYVLAEPDGTVGTVCIYQASSPEAIRDHAKRAELPADEILPVADTVLVRPDPTPTEA
jgi:Protein of unknown function (DUF4242)